MSDLKAGEKSGLKTAVAESFRPDDPLPGASAAVQLPLLPLAQAEPAATGGEPDAPQRGAGRPAGSKNKNTEAWREYMLGRYSAPLVALAETYSRRTFDLAVEMGYCASGIGERRGRGTTDRRDGREDKRATKTNRRVGKNRRVAEHRRRIEPEAMVELLKVQLQCAKELAPYLHQKQPQALLTDGAGLMQLIINTGMATAEQVDAAGVMSMDFIDIETQQEQGVSADNLAELDGEKLDGGKQHTDASTQTSGREPD